MKMSIRNEQEQEQDWHVQGSEVRFQNVFIGWLERHFIESSPGIFVHKYVLVQNPNTVCAMCWMKRSLLLLHLISIAIQAIGSFALPTFSCPEEPISTPVQVPSSTLIRVRKTANSTTHGSLCILVKVTKRINKEYFSPVARSYDGYNWEKVAGPYSSKLQIKCTSDDDEFCTIRVPWAWSGWNEVFQLVTYEHVTSVKDEVARFFEQTTFGTTMKDILAATSSSVTGNGDDMHSYFSTWIHDQMHSVSPTLHRSLWRDNVYTKADTPRREGKITHPCEHGARWWSKAFDRVHVGEMMVVKRINNRYALSVNGHVRTMVDSFKFKDWTIKIENIGLPATFEICLATPWYGNRFGVLLDGVCEEIQQGIPEIDLDGMVPEPQFVFYLNETQSEFVKTRSKTNYKMVFQMIMKQKVAMDPGLCAAVTQAGTPIFAKLQNGQTLLYVPFLVLQSNTLENPLYDGGGGIVDATQSQVQCSNAPRTFLNDATCRLSQSENACTNIHTGDGAYFQEKINLSRKNILDLYKLTGRYVYAVKGLRQYSDIIDFPCKKNSKSRWQPIAITPCPKYLKEETTESFQRLIEKSTDRNPFIRDIYFSGVCHEKDSTRRKLHVEINGVCWTNIHPEEYNVYDFTSWKLNHPGGQEKIGKFADDGSEFLHFPGHHEMWRWETAKDNNLLPLIGRLGDKIGIHDLPESFNTYSADLSTMFRPLSSGNGTVLCGSPGESSGADPAKKEQFQISRLFQMAQSDVYEPESFDQLERDFYNSKKYVWLTIALRAEDQLRQRMAWGLSQLLAVSPSPFGGSLSTEMFLQYYDIFVRNAFGTYKDVLREVSFSPMMGYMLTYHRSKSQEYNWMTKREIQFADENFAREIMQLFSIGLHKLNMEGTFELDDSGDPIRTYTNDEIEEYARAWTGFSRQQLRGNIEEQEGGKNLIDPMKVKVAWRDPFPKLGLDKKYVGDGYMLCSDLPPKAYLREGATYRLLGNSKISDLQYLPLKSRKESADIVVTELQNSSKLRGRLCNTDGSSCRYASSVRLNSAITCVGEECGLDQVQVVQVAPEVYYEYVRPPCVHHTFFKPGHLISRNGGSDIAKCVNPNTAVASAACCSQWPPIATHDTCKYTGELVALSEAEKRCAANGKSLCQFHSMDESSCGKCCNYDGLFWIKGGWDGSGRCQIYAVVDLNGKVAIERQGAKMKDYNSLTFFRVHWKDDFPKHGNGCGNGICEQFGDYCRCRVDTQSNAVFPDAPTAETALASLHVGGASLELADYAATAVRDGMKVHFMKDSREYDSNVVFEVMDRFGRTLFLKNVEAVVQIATADGKTSSDYIFRNPPTFFDAVPEVRDALHETEAVLDHYLFHNNTAPFLAKRFIQRFGQSNPSPRFIKSVADAFVSGSFDSGSASFGSGGYGDLSATVAAILLDRESRHTVLDTDPSYGSLREPLLKVVSVMRSMEYLQTSATNVALSGAKDLIGQMAHELPNVFSFFLPDYAPTGSVSSAALVAPEAMLLYKASGMMNGLLSLVEYGLTSCNGGLGSRCTTASAKNSPASSGFLSYTPPLSYSSDDVVDELCTLLTSGRMKSTSANRRIIRDAYSQISSSSDIDRSQALQVAQQLILLSPEFHSTGITKGTATRRETESHTGKKSCRKYKAVVHLLLNGGMDSYNLLVPHSNCRGKVSYEQYSKVRGSVAIPRSALHTINAAASSQPCNIFGIHPKMSLLKKLYDDKDASFVAGIGVLSEPVNKWNYLTKTKTTLFAHDQMVYELDRLDPFNKKQGTGIIGRFADVLSKKGLNVNKFTVDQDSSPVEGLFETSKVVLDSTNGFSGFNEGGKRSTYLMSQAELLNGKAEGFGNVFSDIWSSTLYNVRDSTSFYFAQEHVDMTDKFPDSSFGRQFKSVAQMIASHECRGSDRDLFALNIEMFDHHRNVNTLLPYYFDLVNEALTSFVNEMKSLGMWDEVTVVVSSDFGRTLSPNSEAGTDHAWSGHSFILGGALDGGKIHGRYPYDLSEKSSLNIGTGRLIPQLPWEAMWNPVGQWLGIYGKDLDHALPNRQKFFSTLLQKKDVFLDDEPSTWNSCSGEGEYVSCVNS